MNCTSSNCDVNGQIRCDKMMYIGVYSCVLFVTSTISNSVYIWTYFKTKVLHVPINTLVLALSLLNLLGTVTEIPLVTFRVFNCKFMFGEIDCYLSGCLMYFIACMSVYLLVAISIERYYTNKKLKKSLTYTDCIKIIIVCGLLGLFWSILPLFEWWSYYSLEGLGISCSVEWHKREIGVISYNISIFIFVFLIPFVTLFVYNVKLIFFIRKYEKKFMKRRRFLSDHSINMKKRIQRDVSRHVVIITICFMISWLPYSLVAMLRALTDWFTITPLMASIPSLFAKSFLLWPSLIILCTSKQIQRNLPFRSRAFNQRNNSTFTNSRTV